MPFVPGVDFKERQLIGILTFNACAALCKKVRNVLRRCHTKRRMCVPDFSKKNLNKIKLKKKTTFSQKIKMEIAKSEKIVK